MLFISTEQVFNGKTKPGPFSEAETPCSVSNYGAQKAEVDAWLHENAEDYVTLRLSWMFGMALPHVSLLRESSPIRSKPSAPRLRPPSP